MSTRQANCLVLLSGLLLACETAPNGDIPNPVVRDLVPGCDGSQMETRDPDPSKPGPWAVGVRTLEVGDLVVEVLYPATPASAEDASLAGQDPMEVDLRYALPESQRALITDGTRPEVRCNCVRDLPLDEGAGPYPLIFFVHGTASWRTQSLSLMTHWASRGFIVAAADHPGLWLADLLAGICGEPVGAQQNLNRDLQQLHAAFRESTGDLAFLAEHVNLERIGIAGHSAGASAAAQGGDLPGVKTVVSLAGNQSAAQSSALSSALFLGGMADEVIPFSQTERAYNNTAQERRLMGISGGGHLVFSDICELTNSEGQNLVEIATEAGVCGTQFASQLFDCAASTIPPDLAKNLVNGSSTWVLERDLQCTATDLPFEDFAQNDWVEVLEAAD